MISVCMATYNGEEYIKKQLDSILMQLDSEDELVISDDGSTDGTIEIIKSYQDIRIRLHKSAESKSPIKNFENALQNSHGDYIFLADQDDVWHPNKVEIIKDYLQRYDLLVSDAFIVDGDDRIISDSFYKVNGSKKGLVSNIKRNSYLGCTMAFNRKILKISLPFPRDLPMHDWWIGLVSEIYGRVIFLDRKLISYRRHKRNASQSAESSNNSFVKKILFRFFLIKGLLTLLVFRKFFNRGSCKDV